MDAIGLIGPNLGVGSSASSIGQPYSSKSFWDESPKPSCAAQSTILQPIPAKE